MCAAAFRREKNPPRTASPDGHRDESTATPRPGARHLRLLLEALDLVVLLEVGHTDIVEPVEQAVLAVRVDVMAMCTTWVAGSDFLLFEIDRQRRVGAAFGIVEQFLQVIGRDLDRQHAVLEAVVVEDVAERGGDHAADAGRPISAQRQACAQSSGQMHLRRGGTRISSPCDRPAC